MTMETKPGWKSSEFALKLLAVLISALLASGLLPEGSVPLKLATIVGTLLAALGYAGLRSWVKVTDSKSAALAEAAAPGPSQPQP
jgi:hypothetical protein